MLKDCGIIQELGEEVEATSLAIVILYLSSNI